MKLALALLFVALGSSAWADALPAPEGTCTDGAVRASCHGGSYCVAPSCTDDATCTGGRVCRAVQACMGSLLCGGDLRPEDMESTRRADYRGPCTGTTCDGGTCQALKLCLAPAAATPTPAPTPTTAPTKSSGCGGGDASTSLGLVLAVIAMRRRVLA